MNKDRLLLVGTFIVVFVIALVMAPVVVNTATDVVQSNPMIDCLPGGTRLLDFVPFIYYSILVLLGLGGLALAGLNIRKSMGIGLFGLALIAAVALNAQSGGTAEAANTACLLRDGSLSMQANLNMGGYAITSVSTVTTSNAITLPSHTAFGAGGTGPWAGVGKLCWSGNGPCISDTDTGDGSPARGLVMLPATSAGNNMNYVDIPVPYSSGFTDGSLSGVYLWAQQYGQTTAVQSWALDAQYIGSKSAFRYGLWAQASAPGGSGGELYDVSIFSQVGGSNEEILHLGWSGRTATPVIPTYLGVGATIPIVWGTNDATGLSFTPEIKFYQSYRGSGESNLGIQINGNGSTGLDILPGGTGTVANLYVWAESDMANSGYLKMGCNNAVGCTLGPYKTGGGDQHGLGLYSGTGEALRLMYNGGVTFYQVINFNLQAVSNMKLPAGATGTCTATERGQVTTVQGGAGAADVSYQCMKKADNDYAWVEAWSAP